MSEELVQSVLQDYGMAPRRTLPTINQFGQFQVGGPLQGREGALDTLFDFLPGVGDARAIEETKKAAGKPLVTGVSEAGVSTDNPLLRGMEIGVLGLGVLPMIPTMGGVVKTAKNLPMDEASRMARAREMGFGDEIYYHGTTEDLGAITEFDPTKRRRSSTIGHYFTGGAKSDPDSAIYQAKGYGRNVGEFKLNLGKHLDLTDPSPEDYKKLKKIFDEYGHYFDNDGGFELGNMEGGFDEFVRLLAEPAGYNDFGGPSFRNDALEFLADPEIGGYDSVSFFDDAFGGGVERSTVVFDPKNIRSTKAAFDPAKKNSANILAGTAAGAVGINALIGNDRETQ